MKEPPDKAFAGYTDSQWTAIKNVAAGAGVEIGDEALIKLTRLAHVIASFDEYKRPTARQLKSRCQERLLQIEPLLQALNEDARVYPARLRKTLRAALRDEAERLQLDIEAFTEAKSASPGNATSSKMVFAKQVLRVWTAAAPGAVRPPKHKDTTAFVLACVNPVFPDTEAGAIERAIRKWRKGG